MGHFIGMNDTQYFVDDDGRVWDSEHKKRLIAESAESAFRAPDSVNDSVGEEVEVRDEQGGVDVGNQPISEYEGFKRTELMKAAKLAGHTVSFKMTKQDLIELLEGGQ